jgi:cytidylate kinase
MVMSGSPRSIGLGCNAERRGKPRKERENMRKLSDYQIDWERLARYNIVVNTRPRDPLQDVVKNDELVSWMKEYPDAMNVINKIKDKK